MSDFGINSEVRDYFCRFYGLANGCFQRLKILSDVGTIINLRLKKYQKLLIIIEKFIKDVSPSFF